MKKLKIWRLKSKEERRFKMGHPWVYSNELQESPKGIEIGEAIELHDASGNFLAFGFGNPGSLIAFRALSRNREDLTGETVPSIEFFARQFKRAFEFRLRWFSAQTSFRAVYGEADDLPGLIIDRYKGEKTIYVVQPHSAGMDKNLEAILQALKIAHTEVFAKSGSGKDQAFAVLRRDAGSREREGLEKIAPVLISLADLQSKGMSEPTENVDWLSPYTFFVPGIKNLSIPLSADLIRGQKTGFFFDQLENIRLVGSLLDRKIQLEKDPRTVKILDLCSYVGQWGVQLADVLIAKMPVSVTVVDASESALVLAEKNLRGAFPAEVSQKKLEVMRVKADVLDPMPALGESQYDVVIADPPALIKSRKVIPQGKQAYVQLMGEAIRRTRPGGIMVACSCSQLLSAEDFIEVLAKAAKRAGRTVRWIAQGSPSVDHFQRFEFREGLYLKCWIGEVF